MGWNLLKQQLPPLGKVQQQSECYESHCQRRKGSSKKHTLHVKQSWCIICCKSSSFNLSWNMRLYLPLSNWKSWRTGSDLQWYHSWSLYWDFDLASTSQEIILARKQECLESEHRGLSKAHNVCCKKHCSTNFLLKYPCWISSVCCVANSSPRTEAVMLVKAMQVAAIVIIWQEATKLR